MRLSLMNRPLVFALSVFTGACAHDPPPPDPIDPRDMIQTEAQAIAAGKAACMGRGPYNPSEYAKWTARLSGSAWNVKGDAYYDSEIWSVTLSKSDGKAIGDGCRVLIIDYL